MNEAIEMTEDVKEKIIGDLNGGSIHLIREALVFLGTHDEIWEDVKSAVEKLLSHECEIVRGIAIDFYCSQAYVEGTVQALIALSLRKDEERVRDSAMAFFRKHQKNVSLEVRAKIMLWLTSDDEMSQLGAVRFYSTAVVSSETHEKITQLLRSPHWLVRQEVLEYFRTRDSVSRADLFNVDVLLDDPKNRIVSAAVKFYRAVSSVPEPIEQHIAKKLLHSDQHVITRRHTISFWQSRQRVPESVEREIEGLLKPGYPVLADAAADFFESRKEDAIPSVREYWGPFQEDARRVIDVREDDPQSADVMGSVIKNAY